MKYRLIIGIFFSLFFIYLSFWKPDVAGLFGGRLNVLQAFFGQTRIDLAQLGQVLVDAHYGYLLLGVAVMLVSLFFRAQRWRILLQPVYRQIRYWPVYHTMNIGYMINNILPLRMGELFRAYFLGRAENISKSSALATIVVERLIDVLAVLVLLSITIFFFPFPGWIRNGLFYVGGGVVVMIAFLLALLINTAWTLKVLRVILKPFPHRLVDGILKIVGSFSSGLEILRSSRHYLIILFHTAMLEVCYIFIVYLTLLAFDLISPQYPAVLSNPLLASVVMLIIITIGIGLPSAPGAVGTFHGIVAFGVSLFGVRPEASMGVAIVLHLSSYLPLTILGLVALWIQNFKFSDVTSQLSKSEREA